MIPFTLKRKVRDEELTGTVNGCEWLQFMWMFEGPQTLQISMQLRPRLNLTHGPGSYPLWLFSWYISISDFAASSQGFSPRTTSGILSGGVRWRLSTLFWVDLFLSGPLDADLPFWPDRCMNFLIFNFFILKIPPCTSMTNQTLKWERRKRDIRFHLGIKKKTAKFFFFFKQISCSQKTLPKKEANHNLRGRQKAWLCCDLAQSSALRDQDGQEETLREGEPCRLVKGPKHFFFFK